MSKSIIKKLDDTIESELNDEDRQLIDRAGRACSSSYSPYSNFQVGAALLLDNGEVLTGSNQENSSYPAGLCAERVVLFYASANYGSQKIIKIAITARRASDTIFIPVTPCGGCRQVLAEMEMKQKKAIEILMQVAEGEWLKTKSAEVLLPFCFSKHSL